MNKKKRYSNQNAVPFAIKERECGQQERDKNQNHTKKMEMNYVLQLVTSVINIINSRKLKWVEWVAPITWYYLSNHFNDSTLSPRLIEGW